MSEPVLVVMAAGMGSRYGGLKQIDPVGDQGEKILDYSLYDAREAGFQKVIFIIKEENAQDFQEAVFSKLQGQIDYQVVYQKLEDVPEGFSVPEGRVKPWGTGHAALCAARALGDAPYAVINADDFYGREGFEKIYKFLKESKEGPVLDLAMVGFYLRNTVTENGYVSRGVCQVGPDGMLQSVTERTRIVQRDGLIQYADGDSWVTLPGSTTVSMGLWGLGTSFLAEAEARFSRFLAEELPQNPLKCEYFLPSVISQLIAEDKAQLKVLHSADKWYGVTYREDKPGVVAALAALTRQGLYPAQF